MNFDLKGMYNYLISHTFPGFLMVVMLILFIKLSYPHHFLFSWPYISKFLHEGVHHFWLLLIIGYIVSTLAGLIIDGLHHLLCEDLHVFPFNRIEIPENKFLSSIHFDNHTLDQYRYYLDQDLWYPYECYANFCITSFIGMGLLIYLFFIDQCILFTTRGWLYLGVLAAISLLMGCEAYFTLKLYAKNKELFLKKFKN